MVNMAHSKIRRQIAWDAARMLVGQQETEIYRARLKAARQLVRGRVRPQDLPDDAEIRAEIKVLVTKHSGISQMEECPTDAVVDRWDHYEGLLLPLEHVRHPFEQAAEGDILYHSLQVYCLVHQECPYDEELLLAALLHDVGRAIDPLDHVQAGIEALAGMVTDRTAWLIEHQPAGAAAIAGTLGTRARRRLRESDSFEDLLLLSRCERLGYRIGFQVPEVNDVLATIARLESDWGD